MVSLEVKEESGGEYAGTRYTIGIGPLGNKSNTRLELSSENWHVLMKLIAELK